MPGQDYVWLNRLFTCFDKFSWNLHTSSIHCFKAHNNIANFSSSTVSLSLSPSENSQMNVSYANLIFKYSLQCFMIFEGLSAQLQQSLLLLQDEQYFLRCLSDLSYRSGKFPSCFFPFPLFIWSNYQNWWHSVFDLKTNLCLGLECMNLPVSVNSCHIYFISLH